MLLRRIAAQNWLESAAEGCRMQDPAACGVAPRLALPLQHVLRYQPLLEWLL
jgi:hypothetical protein